MADSPSHKFGQGIGNLLEEIMLPILEKFCKERDLYLDKKGYRGKARPGSKVRWEDKYGNLHDLDYVIERDGSADKKGRPVAFIEAAWRRYTKHSRNKAQEIQGAILPIADLHDWDKPFLGAVVAGEFTRPSLEQLQSVGFEVLYFPYESIISAFGEVGIDARFNEATPDKTFGKCVKAIEGLAPTLRRKLKDRLVALNKANIDRFFVKLESALGKIISYVGIIPLFGKESRFKNIDEAMTFIDDYKAENRDGEFQKFEIIVQYDNKDQITAAFASKDRALEFLRYFVPHGRE